MGLTKQLSEEEVQKLWENFKKNNSVELRNQLIILYIDIVRYQAERIKGDLPSFVQLDDLISAGTVGLMSAVNKYIPDGQAKFETYAKFRIRGAILDELRNLDWIPRSLRKKANQVERTMNFLEQKFKRPPNDEEIANNLQISLKGWLHLLSQLKGISLLSLEGLIASKDNRDFIEDNRIDESNYKNEARKNLEDSISELPEKERNVLAMYYYEEITFKEIGKVLGVTESRAHQIHAKAILRLRGKLNQWICEVRF